MKSLSISLTLGKQSSVHAVNMKHNNREYYAENIKPGNVNSNIVYIAEAPEKSYEKLFGKALKEYNDSQRKNRKIENYYEHVLKSKREEAYYEIIVQYGDKETAACKSQTGKDAEHMLGEYLNSFNLRNPNLYVFNAAMHLDESTPHLHIDFIPFYTSGRVNGLSKGVSLKAALNEQGFTAKNGMENRLVAWEESERLAMEKILNEYGYEREDKNARHAHMTVSEYKNSKEQEKMMTALSRIKNKNEENSENSITKLKEKLSAAEYKNKNLSKLKESKIVPVYYSSSEKLDFMIQKLSANQIPFSETSTGLELQDYYLDKVRKFEKEFKPANKTFRDQLRDDIDLAVLSSQNLQELLKKLEEKNYTLKHGKYISVKPQDSERYIRLKSLGEFYSENALQNRINSNKAFEKSTAEKIANANKENHFEVYSLQAIKIYMVAVKRNALPRKKKNSKVPFSFTNDAEIDRLLDLNNRINNGLTLEQLNRECSEYSTKQRNILDQISVNKSTTDYLNKIAQHCRVVFENASGNPAVISESRKAVEEFSKERAITKDNYKEIFSIIEKQKSELENLNNELQETNSQLKDSESTLTLAQQVYEGTYVQSIVRDEKIRNVADYVPLGKTVL